MGGSPHFEDAPLVARVYRHGLAATALGREDIALSESMRARFTPTGATTAPDLYLPVFILADFAARTAGTVRFGEL